MTRSPAPVLSDAPEGSNPSGYGFDTTQWSVVLSAARSDPKTSHEALEMLCRAYWRPLYGYVRRSGRSREDAEDLVQGFFASFLEKKAVEDVDRERGRFRAYLLACLKHYMCNEWRRERSQKRGGNALHLPLDWEDAEARYRLEAPQSLNPDRLYDREWTLTLIEQVLDRLQSEAEADGKGAHFEHFKKFLTFDRGEIPYDQVAVATNMSAGAVRVAVHRLRKRYRALLREEIGRTLSSHERLEEEMKALFAALSE